MSFSVGNRSSWFNMRAVLALSGSPSSINTELCGCPGCRSSHSPASLASLFLQHKAFPSDVPHTEHLPQAEILREVLAKTVQTFPRKNAVLTHCGGEKSVVQP